MPLSHSGRSRIESDPEGSRHRRRSPIFPTFLLTVASLPFSIPSTLAQTDSYSRIALQVASQEDPKLKVKREVRRPLDSDALYVCTLSGFGNLAHCYPR
jgi:hypothetical protein